MDSNFYNRKQERIQSYFFSLLIHFLYFESTTVLLHGRSTPMVIIKNYCYFLLLVNNKIRAVFIIFVIGVMIRCFISHARPGDPYASRFVYVLSAILFSFVINIDPNVSYLLYIHIILYCFLNRIDIFLL